MNDTVNSVSPASFGTRHSIQILKLIAEEPDLSQRDIADQSGISLGLVNLTLKRLVKTGHIKMAGLNKRKVRYLLTPKGFIEKANHSYSYLSQTIKVFMEYQERLQNLILQCMQEGNTSFAILGSGEVSNLVELALRNHLAKVHFRRLEPDQTPNNSEIVLDCRANGKTTYSPGIRVLSALLGEKGKAVQ